MTAPPMPIFTIRYNVVRVVTPSAHHQGLKMEEGKDEFAAERWNLYFDTVVGVGDSWKSGLEIILERKPTDSAFDMGLGRVLSAASQETKHLGDEDGRIFQVALSFQIEEMPRLIAVLNEVYLRHYAEAFDEIRLDQEITTGDNNDRLATLQAYRVFADKLSDFAESTGLLGEY